MTQRTLRFTLLGTGSSGGVPRVGNDWGACDPSEPRNRRTRCSALVELYANDGSTAVTRILIDTSPDLRQQLLTAGVDRLDAVFITHDHADQTHGMDDLRALALRSKRRIPVHMDKPTSKTLVSKFDYCFEGKGGYPPILELCPLLLPGTSRTVEGSSGSLTVLPLSQQHGGINSLGFRVGNIAYCNDVSDLPEESLQALHGLDVLIVDALRYAPHPSHAHLEKTLSWVKQLSPKHTILTNLHIDMDYQTLLSELPANVEPGYDGMFVEIPYHPSA